MVGEWRFSRIHCDIFVTLDVMMCTASILNLCAISIDRWGVHGSKSRQIHSSVSRPSLYGLILLVTQSFENGES